MKKGLFCGRTREKELFWIRIQRESITSFGGRFAVELVPRYSFLDFM